ncbi:MAG TPA: type II secretion system protein [Tepidisphaeraceae bacterium]|nr:type II secretion system protein [Tepidisphaeraceae bacterium]
MLSKNSKQAFTLIEILIVVIILGVLAAIVIPRFANASKDAKRAALSSQLNQIRAQIQLYTIEHGDTRPPNFAGSDWTDLTTQSVYNGVTRGPYLPSVPINTLNGYTNIAVINADPAWGDPVVGANIGYVYNSLNGVIWGTNTAGDKVYNESNPSDPAN